MSEEEVKNLRQGLQKKWEVVHKEYQNITHITKIDTVGLRRKWAFLKILVNRYHPILFFYFKEGDLWERASCARERLPKIYKKLRIRWYSKIKCFCLKVSFNLFYSGESSPLWTLLVSQEKNLMNKNM